MKTGKNETDLPKPGEVFISPHGTVVTVDSVSTTKQGNYRICYVDNKQYIFTLPDYYFNVVFKPYKPIKVEEDIKDWLK